MDDDTRDAMFRREANELLAQHLSYMEKTLVNDQRLEFMGYCKDCLFADKVAHPTDPLLYGHCTLDGEGLMAVHVFEDDFCSYFEWDEADTPVLGERKPELLSEDELDILDAANQTMKLEGSHDPVVDGLLRTIREQREVIETLRAGREKERS